MSTKINKLIALDLIAIAASLLLINYSNIDVKIQNYFFDFDKKIWIIDSSESIKKFFFYKLPKISFAIAAVACAVFAILGFKKKSQFAFQNRHKFLLIFLGMIFIPLIAGNIKKFTNIYCPSQLEIYGGNYPYVKILDSYDADFHQAKKGKCFPAGHAITGFALMILFFALEKKRNRILSLIFANLIGWITGIYQMLKGAHFLGDTLIAMLLCFLLAAIITKIYYRFIKTEAL